MKKIILSFILIAAIGCNVQKAPTAVKDISGNLVGIANKEHFLQKPYNNWFTTHYNNYQTNAATIEKLKPLLKKVTIKAFMGTWCGDSKRQTPAFYKVLEEANFNFNHLTMVAVNRSKETPQNLQDGHNIQRVPTFIFYKNGKEIGRFVEFPMESIEADFLQIVSGKNYQHAYYGEF